MDDYFGPGKKLLQVRANVYIHIYIYIYILIYIYLDLYLCMGNRVNQRLTHT